jgi:hypothetical protein
MLQIYLSISFFTFTMSSAYFTDRLRYISMIAISYGYVVMTVRRVSYERKE